MNILGIILYGILGVALNWAGVGIFDKPLQFLVILGLVIAIDVTTWVRYS